MIDMAFHHSPDLHVREKEDKEYRNHKRQAANVQKLREGLGNVFFLSNVVCWQVILARGRAEVGHCWGRKKRPLLCPVSDQLLTWVRGRKYSQAQLEIETETIFNCWCCTNKQRTPGCTSHLTCPAGTLLTPLRFWAFLPSWSRGLHREWPRSRTAQWQPSPLQQHGMGKTVKTLTLEYCSYIKYITAVLLLVQVYTVYTVSHVHFVGWESTLLVIKAFKSHWINSKRKMWLKHVHIQDHFHKPVYKCMHMAAAFVSKMSLSVNNSGFPVLWLCKWLPCLPDNNSCWVSICCTIALNPHTPHSNSTLSHTVLSSRPCFTPFNQHWRR